MKEKILKKYNMIFALLISFAMLFISSIFSWDENPVMGIDKACADILIIFTCILLIRKLNLWENAGFKKEGFLKGIKYGIPFLIIGVLSVIFSNAGTNISSLKFISLRNMLIFTFNMILVGLNEEIWMRSLILNIFLKKYETSKKGVWKSIILSAIVFGVIHIPNIMFINPITLMVQVINATSAGILFAVIFIKCRNIWSVAAIHGIVDWLSLFVANCFIGGSSVLSISMSISQAVMVIFLGSFPPLIIAWLYLRKYKS